jgi:hypothetical protein
MKTVAEVLAKIRTDLDYRTPGASKPLGHIVLERADAAVLVALKLARGQGGRGDRYWLWMSGPIVEDVHPAVGMKDMDESERWYSYIVLPQAGGAP